MTRGIEYGGNEYTLELKPQALLQWGQRVGETAHAIKDALADMEGADHERIARLARGIVTEYTAGLPREVVEAMPMGDVNELFRIIERMAKDILIEAALAEETPMGRMH